MPCICPLCQVFLHIDKHHRAAHHRLLHRQNNLRSRWPQNADSPPVSVSTCRIQNTLLFPHCSLMTSHVSHSSPFCAFCSFLWCAFVKNRFSVVLFWICHFGSSLQPFGKVIVRHLLGVRYILSWVCITSFDFRLRSKNLEIKHVTNLSCKTLSSFTRSFLFSLQSGEFTLTPNSIS